MTRHLEHPTGRQWRPNKERKPRSDSKLHGLAREQRAMVDKWLFDKGLTYQAVSEACFQMFGLRVSRSSVGRYHEREMRGNVKRVSGRVGKCVSEEADEEVGGWAKEMCIGMLTGRGTPETGEVYEKTLAWMTAWALEEMKWPVEDERDIKTVLRFMRILISARRERNEADMMKLAREKFEMKAGRQCLKHLQSQRVSEGVGKCVSERKKETAAARWPNKGEKDPMMMWDFPDGKIRRLPLLRPGRTEGERDD